MLPGMHKLAPLPYTAGHTQACAPALRCQARAPTIVPSGCQILQSIRQPWPALRLTTHHVWRLVLVQGMCHGAGRRMLMNTTQAKGTSPCATALCPAGQSSFRPLRSHAASLTPRCAGQYDFSHFTHMPPTSSILKTRPQGRAEYLVSQFKYAGGGHAGVCVCACVCLHFVCVRACVCVYGMICPLWGATRAM